MPDQRPTTVVDGPCSFPKDKPAPQGAYEASNVRDMVGEPSANNEPNLPITQAGQKFQHRWGFRRLATGWSTWEPLNGCPDVARSPFVIQERTRVGTADPPRGSAHV